MRTATLIACNTAGVITTASISHDETDENEVVQLTIGEFVYKFNNDGIMQNANVAQSCVNLNSHSSCAQRLQGVTCIPTCEPKFKFED
jgi:hypothetical protein